MADGRGEGWVAHHQNVARLAVSQHGATAQTAPAPQGGSIQCWVKPRTDPVPVHDPSWAGSETRWSERRAATHKALCRMLQSSSVNSG